MKIRIIIIISYRLPHFRINNLYNFKI